METTLNNLKQFESCADTHDFLVREWGDLGDSPVSAKDMLKTLSLEKMLLALRVFEHGGEVADEFAQCCASRILSRYGDNFNDGHGAVRSTEELLDIVFADAEDVCKTSDIFTLGALLSSVAFANAEWEIEQQDPDNVDESHVFANVEAERLFLTALLADIIEDYP